MLIPLYDSQLIILLWPSNDATPPRSIRQFLFFQRKANNKWWKCRFSPLDIFIFSKIYLILRIVTGQKKHSSCDLTLTANLDLVSLVNVIVLGIQYILASYTHKRIPIYTNLYSFWTIGFVITCCYPGWHWACIHNVFSPRFGIFNIV